MERENANARAGSDALAALDEEALGTFVDGFRGSVILAGQEGYDDA